MTRPGQLTPNPMDRFLDAKKNRYAKQREQTQQLWQQWDQGGRKSEDIEPLLEQFNGLVGAKTRDWKPPLIPKSAFEAELNKQLIKAIHSYKPDKGASLNTHANIRLQKAKRYVIKNQNMAYIPEGAVQHIGSIQKAQDELTEQFGRKPTNKEIGQKIGLPTRRVGTIIKSMRADIPSSAWESDPEPQSAIREQEILPLLRETLNSKEQKVFDHIYGFGGMPKVTSTGALAKQLGTSPSQISRIKSSIGAKYKEHL